MSEYTSKETRRELRRVLGTEAEGALRQQAEAVGFLSTTLRRHQEMLGVHGLDLCSITDSLQRCTDLLESLQCQQRFTNAVLSRNLAGRFRWLLAGR